jgi:hypothetical protein
MAESGPALSRVAKTAPERFSGLTLNLPDPNAFPFRQTVRIPAGPVTDTRNRVRAALESAGFQLAGTSAQLGTLTGHPPAMGGAIVAERDLRRAPMSTQKRRATGIILACGLGLGVLDALLFANVLTALPWFAGTFVAVLALWLAFGRAYASEVVIAVIELDSRGTASTDIATDGVVPHQVTWLAAEVRSEVFRGSAGGNRDAVDLSGDFVALRALRAVLRKFESGPRSAEPPA